MLSSYEYSTHCQRPILLAFEPGQSLVGRTTGSVRSAGLIGGVGAPICAGAKSERSSPLLPQDLLDPGQRSRLVALNLLEHLRDIRIRMEIAAH